MSFDVPVVGVSTIQTMIDAGARCLSVTTENASFDREEMIGLADRNKVCIVGL